MLVMLNWESRLAERSTGARAGRSPSNDGDSLLRLTSRVFSRLIWVKRRRSTVLAVFCRKTHGWRRATDDGVHEARVNCEQEEGYRGRRRVAYLAEHEAVSKVALAADDR